jgi:glycosyltransferase involved in cell wall biosynthesis
VLNIRFYLGEPLKQALFRVADAMLQNSGREPFGLVGLEVMAAGGVAFTGATGEEYARPWDNAVVLSTPDPREIEVAVLTLLARTDLAGRIRRQGPETARLFTWDHAVDAILHRLQHLAS